MSEAAYVVVFPNEFSKNKISQLIINIKKILKAKNQEYVSVKRDDDVILVDANDPVFASSAINLLFGIDKIAISRQTKNNFDDIVSEITSVGGNLLLKNERFLIRVEGITKGFFAKDVELAATSSIIEKKANMEAKPGTDNDYDKMIYTYLTKKNAYISIFSDEGQGGIPYQSQNQKAICSVYDEISAISCYETIKQGFDSKIIVCYRKESELMSLAKVLNQIIPRLVKKEVEIEFFHIKVSGSGMGSYLLFLSCVFEIMVTLAKESKIDHVSVALSPLMFSGKFIDETVKRIFQKGLIPVIPMSGLDSNLFGVAREIRLENSIPKIKRLISKRSNDSPKHSEKIVSDAIKSRQSIAITIGPNNVHDILDSLKH